MSERTRRISYRTAHLRVDAARGKPSLCEFCGTTEARRFEWALAHHAEDRILDPHKGCYYSLDPMSYFRLCEPCHRIYDADLRTSHCPAGHSYSGDNLIVRYRRDGRAFRVCRECETRRNRARDRRKKSTQP